MIWNGYWSGIDIEAENDEEDKILKELFVIIPKDANNDGYDDGILELETMPDGHVKLNFTR